MQFVRETAYHQVGRVPLVRHRHTDADSFELIQVLHGGGSALISDKTYPLLPGTLLLIDAAYVHAINPEQDADYCRNKLIVTKSALLRALNAIGDENGLHAYTEHGGKCFVPTPELAEQIDQIFYILTAESPADSRTALCAVLRLLRIADRRAEAAEPETDDRIGAVLNYLRTHFAESVTVERVAADTHLSKYHLCRLFRAQTGMTIMQYLNEQRMASARSLLAHSDRSVGDIAQDCGFGSSSHFCTVFRAQENLSPREFRQKHGFPHPDTTLPH